MSEHTPEPWRYESGFYQTGRQRRAFARITDSEGRIVLTVGQYAKNELRRTVACVNACAGITTEALEGYGQKPWALADELAMAQYATGSARLAEAERLLRRWLYETKEQPIEETQAFLGEAKP